MDAFNPEMIAVYRAEMEHRAEHHRLVKTARARCASWLRRTANSVQDWSAAQQVQRRKSRQVRSWETAEMIVAHNPNLTAGSKC